MKKLTLFYLFFAVLVLTLFSTPVDKSTALINARKFLNQQPQRSFAPGRALMPQVVSEPVYIAESAHAKTPLYYVYNLSNDGGFIILSADTRVNQVLGYSFNGSFDNARIPYNMQGWLDDYAGQIEYAITYLPEKASIPTIRRTPTTANSIEPLLGNIAYNQSAPYNNLCPMDGSNRSVTGCVATAMAQIMRYYRHPQRGKGSKTYKTGNLGITLSVDFSTAMYDWENMLPAYNASATSVQNNAVSTLMYHAGVAVEMNYSASSSGASAMLSAIALREFFDYDKSIDMLDREYYSAQEWLGIIKQELIAHRPLMFSGQSNSGGHAFICDGYDADNLVHINWGWGGYQDGYFQLSAFDPKGIGIGGGSGGYNLNQSIIIGIQKPTEESTEPQPKLNLNGLSIDKLAIGETETASITLTQVKAVNLAGFTGKVGVALYNSSGDFVKIIRSGNVPGLPFNSWYLSYPFNNIVSTAIRPDETTVGTFFIKAVCQPQGASAWIPMRVAIGAVPYIQAEIDRTTITFTTPNMFFSIKQAVPAVIKNTVYTIFSGKNLNVELQLLNSGNVEYNAQIGIKAISVTDDAKIYDLANVKTILPIGETTTVNLCGTIHFPVGDYRLEVYYDPANIENNFTFPTQKVLDETTRTVFSVINAPAPYKLSLVKSTEMPSEVEQGVPFKFKAFIQNTGGLFTGNLVLSIYKSKNDGSNYYSQVYNSQPSYFEIQTETKAIEIIYTLNLEPSNDYVALLFYQEDGKTNVSFGSDSKNWRYLTIKPKVSTDATDSEIRNEMMTVYPNPTSSYVVVELLIGSTTGIIQINDMNGKTLEVYPVNSEKMVIDIRSLPKGIYLIKSGKVTRKLVVN